MAIIYGLWIKCDECGNGAGDAGVAIEAPFELKGTTEQERLATEREAVGHAVDNGFVETPDGRLLCFDCAEPAEDDDEDADDPHSGCWQPHVRGGEYFDCDGRPVVTPRLGQPQVATGSEQFLCRSQREDRAGDAGPPHHAPRYSAEPNPSTCPEWPHPLSSSTTSLSRRAVRGPLT